MKHYQFVLLALLFSCGCQNGDSVKKQNFKATVKTNPPIHYNFLRNIKYELQLINEFQSLSTSHYYYTKEQLLIGYDRTNQNFLVYDSAFKLKKYGQYGMGPNEIDDACFFRFDSDSSYVIFDLGKQRLGRFSLENKLIESFYFNNNDISFVQYLGGTPNKNIF